MTAQQCKGPDLQPTLAEQDWQGWQLVQQGRAEHGRQSKSGRAGSRAEPTEQSGAQQSMAGRARLTGLAVSGSRAEQEG